MVGSALVGVESGIGQSNKELFYRGDDQRKSRRLPGLSFGGYKDFLVTGDSRTGARRLQLEVDVEATRWAFRVGGQLMQRRWWDAAVTSVE
jgi:hypothetical protein